MRDVLRDAELRRAELVTAAARSQRRACDAAVPAAGAAVDALNDDMRRVWHNQQRLKTEMCTLQRESGQLCAQAQSWVHMYEAFHGALKALGDVENWADVLRRDMALVSGTIERAQREQAAASGQSDVYTPLSLPPRTPRSDGGGSSAGTPTVRAGARGDRGGAPAAPLGSPCAAPRSAASPARGQNVRPVGGASAPGVHRAKSEGWT
ncbi:hypothetical protein KFE25_004678 [Diacronema lutheri]|uniref:Biogenesis of lysosome-related organelles complex 1 subunit 1 n=2 Tax=Diacronema lutheri TaxID=2081491 RepID=A0A8J5XF67_DIALT|nr:hypothetical protein KFE25_004678 [Diacronema lutheri]